MDTYELCEHVRTLNDILCFSYTMSVLPYVAPYLLPATNTLMTCSVYATVAVAVNRQVQYKYEANHQVAVNRSVP